MSNFFLYVPYSWVRAPSPPSPVATWCTRPQPHPQLYFQGSSHLEGGWETNFLHKINNKSLKTSFIEKIYSVKKDFWGIFEQIEVQ
jgi:hypothetical protein